ncbi:hypothetical protein B296_00028604 [Ensete ventricosum]|uniref:Uncharacterized protein n=1 Tax=Ensete ventricosum TaxID=4639 RepID=A0A427AMF5_ENSVE|nr:hypothetical protein B296_00028604 [Ensete ventricosum]
MYRSAVGMVHTELAYLLSNRVERTSQLLHQPDAISIEEVASSAKPVVRAIRKIPKRLKKLIELLPQQEVLI